MEMNKQSQWENVLDLDRVKSGLQVNNIMLNIHVVWMASNK